MMQNCFGGLSKKYSQWNFSNELEAKTQSVILGLASKIPVKSDIVFFISQYKIWVKPSGEQSFLYGNHILKSGLGRITENTPQYQGVIVYSMNDLPLVSELNSRISVSRKYSSTFSLLKCNCWHISVSLNNSTCLEVEICLGKTLWSSQSLGLSEACLEHQNSL